MLTSILCLHRAHTERVTMRRNIHKVTSMTLPHIVTFHGSLHGKWQIIAQILFHCVLNTDILHSDMLYVQHAVLGTPRYFHTKVYYGRMIGLVWYEKLIERVCTSHSQKYRAFMWHYTPTNKLLPSMCYCFHEWLRCLVKYRLYFLFIML